MSDRPASRRAIDLSHEIVDGMVTHPGIPGPTISTFLTHEASAARYAPGTTFEIGRIDLVANTGTYLDTPAHRFAGRADLSDLDLATVVDLDAVLVDVRGRDARAIEADAFAGIQVAGRAVLVATGWDRHWGTDAYLSDNPFLTEAAARHLVAAGAALIGIDSLNVDSLADPRRPGAHRDPRCGHPAGRAPHRPRWAPARWLPVLRRPSADPRDGDLPGPGLRAHRRLIAGPSGPVRRRARL